MNRLYSRLLPVLVLFFFLPGFRAGCQPAIKHDETLINGFAIKLSGDDYSYHSSIHTVTESLIVRATDGNYSMEWETEDVPGDIKGKYITFAWLAGLDAGPGTDSMEFYVNGYKTFTIFLDEQRSWELSHPDGSSLAFHTDEIDEHGDYFGFMFLRIPGSSVNTGEPVRLRVTGGKQESNSWYMTFKTGMPEGLAVRPFPVIRETGDQQEQKLSCGLSYFGEERAAEVYLDGILINSASLDFGYNRLGLWIPAVSENTVRKILVQAGDNSEETEFIQEPVRKWKVSFVQHSHTDIGYTRPQSEILAEHMRYIDYALDYCDQTDNYPDEARFRWTCETTWAVDEYLRSRPRQQTDRLQRRVKEGRIELTAMYLNFDELPDEQSLAASLAPLAELRKRDLPVKVAMQNDVNGIAWCLNEYFHDIGVEYLNMGTHGHRALICFEVPTLFWWESPSGKRMLAFRAEHYMTGNHLYLETGDMEGFETRLLNYLSELQQKGYAYDRISIQFSGYRTDNSPPSTSACEMIRRWNEKYTWPKIRTATATDFFQEMESGYAEEFPVIRGAWPDWWTDGFGASAREVSTVRKAQSEITANMSGLAMASAAGITLPAGIQDRMDLVNDALLFYTEHTVGYHASVREPYHKQSMEQRALKESYAWEADRRSRLIREEALGLLQSVMARESQPSLVVFNTLNWERDGLLRLFIDHQIVDPESSLLLTDLEGKEYPVQLDSHHKGASWWYAWIKGVPAFGYKKFLISTVDDPIHVRESGLNKMDNRWYKLTVDVHGGAIQSIMDKELGTDLVDPDSEWGMGQFIYEQLGNRRQLELFKLDDYSRSPLDSSWVEEITEGPLWNTVRLNGTSAAAMEGTRVEMEIRLFNPVKRIDLLYNIVKKPLVEPEGIYIAFPFKLAEGKLYFDVQGGNIRAGSDQIPGSANDWNTVQNFATLRNEKAQVVLVSHELPLMQFGSINTGRYINGAMPEATHMYSWPMNNYWTTNFNAYQTGTHTWSYSLTSGGDADLNTATRFSWGGRVPFLTRILPGGGEGNGITEASFLKGWPENVILVSAKPAPDGKASILHIRETAGRETDLRLQGMSVEGLDIQRVDVLGHAINTGSTLIQPWESCFFMLFF